MAYTFDENLVSDLHKDAYGFRPREGFWTLWNDYSDDDKQIVWDSLCRAVESELNLEKKRQAAAVASFEAQVAENIKLGAAGPAVATRWILDSLNLSDVDLKYGGDYVCFELGLPYEMRSLFDPICKAMLAERERVE